MALSHRQLHARNNEDEKSLKIEQRITVQNSLFVKHFSQS